MNIRGELKASWAEGFSLMSRHPIEEPHETSGDGNLLQGFESPEAAEALLKVWQVSTDPSSSGHSYGEMEVILPGANGTGHALRFKDHFTPAPGATCGYLSARYVFSLPPE